MQKCATTTTPCAISGQSEQGSPKLNVMALKCSLRLKQISHHPSNESPDVLEVKATGSRPFVYFI